MSGAEPFPACVGINSAPPPHPLQLVFKVTVQLQLTHPFTVCVSLFFPPEGEQEEAWLTEAGLAQMVDNSLAPNVEEVTDICPVFELPSPSPF